MKTTKRVLAIVLAALMLAVMIPFAVSAADETYSLNVTSSKEGFAFDVYKVADLDLVTGNYSNAVDETVMTAINTGDSAAVLAACDALTNAGTPVASYTAEDSGVKTISGLKAGIYYIKKTAAPETVTSVTNRIIPLPAYTDGEWKAYEEVIDLATKITTQPVVSKQILDSKETPVYTTAAIGEDVKFELKATVAGSLTQKLESYSITDKIDDSLTMKADTVKVALEKGAATKEITAFSVSEVKDGSFSVDINKDYLAQDEFYGYTNVVVTYLATLNNKAKIGADGNENSDGLVFKHIGDADFTTVPGNTVYVFSLEIDVIKVDASNGKTITSSPAKFTLLAEDQKTVVAEGETSEGVIKFPGLDQGTYYVKETAAPEGYNINSTVFKIELKPEFAANTEGVIKMSLGDGDKYELKVEDTPAKLPQTGGQGNMIFMIIGGSLILCAGVLFVIVIGKKSAK